MFFLLFSFVNFAKFCVHFARVSTIATLVQYDGTHAKIILYDLSQSSTLQHIFVHNVFKDRRYCFCLPGDAIDLFDLVFSINHFHESKLYKI